MSVWETLIGVAERALKEKPRRDVLMALVSLRSAMVVCQEVYEDYQDLLRQGNYERIIEERSKSPQPEPGRTAIVYDPKYCWPQTVNALAEELVSIRPVIEIFSSEVAQVLEAYSVTEAENARDFSEPLSPEEIQESTQKNLDIDTSIGRESMGSLFEQALHGLDAFIKANFKPEEVFSAQKGVRVWPWPLEHRGDWLFFP
jgi:hypothetical protein